MPDVQKHELSEIRKSLLSPTENRGRRIWSLAEIDARPIVLAFSMCAGAVAYFSLAHEPSHIVAFAAFLSSMVAYFLSRRFTRVKGIHTLIVVIFGVLLGFTSSIIRTKTVSSPTVTADTGPVMLEGWVTSIEPGKKGPRVRLQVHAIAGKSSTDLPRYVRLTHMARLEVHPGRFVRCWAVMKPPPKPHLVGDYDFQRHAWFQQLGAVGYVQGRCRGGALGAPSNRLAGFKLKIASFRRNLATYVNRASGERAGGFAAALVSGDRSFMPFKDQEALRASGLAHLLAISGLHMGIVGGLVFLIFRRALAFIEPVALRISVQKPAAVAALVASLSYLILSGASVSTQRAFIMSAVVFGAVLFDRAAISLRSFAVAMIIVVLLQPESVMSPGFQMSFAASGALIATYEAWTQKRLGQTRILGPIRYAWASLIVTSTVAALATAPFAMYHFNRIAGLGLLANFLAMPIISFVSAPAAAVTLIAAPFGGADLGLRIFGFSLELVIAIANWCTSLMPAGLTAGKQMPNVSLALFSLALILSVLARGVWRLSLPIVPLLGASWVWMQAPALLLHWSPSGDLFVDVAEHGIVRVEVADGDALPPMRFASLTKTSQCATGICELRTAAGQIVVLSDPRVAVQCQTGSGTIAIFTTFKAPPQWTRKDTCIPVYDWEQVEKQGGLSLWQAPAGHVKASSTSKCGTRPWKPCPD